MEELILQVTNLLPEPYKTIALATLAAIGAAAVVAAAAPRGKEGSLWHKVRPAIDWLAANVGNAKNEAK